MNLIYNSDSFSVLQIDPVPGADQAAADDRQVSNTEAPAGGYEIVDKWHRTGIFLHGEMARRFQSEAQALSERNADPEAIDAFLAGFSGLAQQPVVLH